MQGSREIKREKENKLTNTEESKETIDDERRTICKERRNHRKQDEEREKEKANVVYDLVYSADHNTEAFIERTPDFPIARTQ